MNCVPNYFERRNIFPDDNQRKKIMLIKNRLDVRIQMVCKK